MESVYIEGEKVNNLKVYSANFDTKLYQKFKDKAQENNRSLNEYLNLKIREFAYNIRLKKYEEDKNYSHKKVFLTVKNRHFVKNAYYIHDLIMRDYIQSLMEHTLKLEV